ncbi:MAG: HemK family protein methyltransferase [Pseudomonadales bacterium]|nr:HemK family protein methyltransferase [Candidatus Woesebacteria bacterium]MCB9801686.1 HemK family protein methyltransferase [Pseudomonadales bacterium]
MTHASKKNNTRILSPYEQTHLARYKPEVLQTIEQYGQMPVEYISGVAEFCGHLFCVDESVLIPRIETEQLVQMAVETARQLSQTIKQPLSILELGTGSGAVAISLSLELEKHAIAHHIVVSDVSTPALSVVQKNQEALLENPNLVELVQSDLFENITQRPFGIIIANLPYIPTQRIAKLTASVKDFEPYQALDGGRDGFEIIERFLDQVNTYVHQHSVLLLEIDHTHTREHFQPHLDRWRCELFADEFGKSRFAQLTKQ